MSKVREGSSDDLAALLQELISVNKNALGIFKEIGNISKRTTLLSLNSAIEAGRAGEAGKGFGVIAQQIQAMAKQSEDANKKSYGFVDELNRKINDIVGVRTADMAYEVMDKIERNLFERNCDVQAWATFESLINFLADPSEDRYGHVRKLLRNLYRICGIYYDIIITDNKGKVICSAQREDILNEDVSTASWYTNVMDTKAPYTSDVYFSKSIDDYTVAYSAPIFNDGGNCVGVISTRFNWNCIYDIINNTKVGENGCAYLIDEEGKIIASNNRADVMKKNITNLPGVQDAMKGKVYGYCIGENDLGELESIIGYAHTSGFKDYKGKGWSMIVVEHF